MNSRAGFQVVRRQHALWHADRCANVASAQPLTLGADGNYFIITGTTGIQGIVPAKWFAGTMVSCNSPAASPSTHNSGRPARRPPPSCFAPGQTSNHLRHVACIGLSLQRNQLDTAGASPRRPWAIPSTLLSSSFSRATRPAIEYYAPAVALINANCSPSTKIECGRGYLGCAASRRPGAVGSVGTVTFGTRHPALSTAASGTGWPPLDIERRRPSAASRTTTPRCWCSKSGSMTSAWRSDWRVHRRIGGFQFSPQTLAALPAMQARSRSLPFLYHETWGAGRSGRGRSTPGGPRASTISSLSFKLRSRGFGGTYRCHQRPTSLRSTRPRTTHRHLARYRGFLTIGRPPTHEAPRGWPWGAGCYQAALSVVPQ